MSYILDALNKDQAPQETELPLLPKRSEPQTTVKRWGLWLVVAALLVNAGLLAWYLFRDSNSSATTQPTAHTAPGASRELVMVPAQQRQQTTPATSPPATTDSSRAAIPRRVPDRTLAVTRTPTTEQPATARASAPATTTTAPADAFAGAPESIGQLPGGGRVLSPEQAAKLGIGQDAPAPAPAATVAPSQPLTSDRPSVEPTQATRAPQPITVEQLPAAARRGFPELEFSTHIFADDPSMRAVVVNDKRLTEGEQLGELVLRSVTEDGVVFDYRSHLVAVSVVELWAE